VQAPEGVANLHDSNENLYHNVTKKNEILFWVGEVEALLQFLVCALASANCKCAYTCGLG
jgi:hypothetical protein